MNSIEIIKENFDKLLGSNKQSIVIAINGEWGIGKTYFINEHQKQKKYSKILKNELISFLNFKYQINPDLFLYDRFEELKYYIEYSDSITKYYEKLRNDYINNYKQALLNIKNNNQNNEKIKYQIDKIETRLRIST